MKRRLDPYKIDVIPGNIASMIELQNSHKNRGAPKKVSRPVNDTVVSPLNLIL